MNKNMYVLPNGKEVEMINSYEGRYMRLLVKREYLSGPKKGDIAEAEEWKDVECKKIEKANMVANQDLLEVMEVLDTYILAEKKDWNKYPNDIENYTADYAMNCEYSSVIEVVLQTEEYKRRLFINFEGRYSFLDFVSGLEDNLWEELTENKDKYFIKNEDEVMVIEFYTDEGEYTDIEFYSPGELAKAVRSVRVVEFNEKIVEYKKDK